MQDWVNGEVKAYQAEQQTKLLQTHIQLGRSRYMDGAMLHLAHEQAQQRSQLSTIRGKQHPKNVKGGPLQLCSKKGMAMTGFTRNGKCMERNDDTGSHHICIDLKKVGSQRDFCQVT